MDIHENWLKNVRKVSSPNYDERPLAEKISLIVIHSISLPPNKFDNEYIDQLFCNKLDPNAHPYFKKIYQLKVSTHILIKRLGEITQYVAFDKRAWHAGVSEYQNRKRCSDFSIGIELEGCETTAYTDKQYQQLALVIKTLLIHYPNLSTEHIVGHSDIALGRKTDPGKIFDWNRLLLILKN